MSAERYREISFSRLLDSGDDPYEADMRVVFDMDGRSYRRILSRVRQGVYTDVSMEGDAALYEKRLMHEKRVMADFDDANRPGRPLLKEVTIEQEPVCPACGGLGECEDKHGNWKPCKQCTGSNDVER